MSEVTDVIHPEKNRSQVSLISFMYKFPTTLFPNVSRVDQGFVKKPTDFVDLMNFGDEQENAFPMITIDDYLRTTYGNPRAAIEKIDAAYKFAGAGNPWSADAKDWMPLYNIASPIYIKLRTEHQIPEGYLIT